MRPLLIRLLSGVGTACVIALWSPPASAQNAAATGWRVQATPTLSIGDGRAGPATELYRVIAAIRRSDGRFVIADNSTRIQLFDAGGRPISAVGGRGAGPGEFSSISWAQLLPGDSLLVFDRDRRRFSFYTSQLEFTRSVDSEATSFPRHIGRFADGTIVAAVTVPSITPAGTVLRRATLQIVRQDEAGERIGVFATVAGDETLRFPSTPVIIAPTYLRRPQFAVGERTLYVAPSDRFEVEVFDLDGTRIRTLQRQHPPVPLTRGEMEGLLGDFIPNLDMSFWPADHTFPAISDILLDDEGNLWVQKFELTTSAPKEFSVFDAAGTFLFTVNMPASFRPTHIGNDFVLGVWRDDLDIEYVRLHALTKSGVGAR